MSVDGPVTVDAITTQEDLQHAIQHLTDRITKLEAELEAERDSHEETKQELADQRDLLDTRYRNLLDDIIELETRVDDAFQSTVQGEVDPDDALPVMQVTRTYQSEPRSLTDTQRRAAVVWSNYFDFCTTTPGSYVLTSGEVGKILAAHDEDTHRETRHRVMELVSELGRQYITIDSVNGKNALVIDRKGFDEYAATLTEAVDS